MPVLGVVTACTARLACIASFVHSCPCCLCTAAFCMFGEAGKGYDPGYVECLVRARQTPGCKTCIARLTTAVLRVKLVCCVQVIGLLSITALIQPLPTDFDAMLRTRMGLCRPKVLVALRYEACKGACLHGPNPGITPLHCPNRKRPNAPSSQQQPSHPSSAVS